MRVLFVTDCTNTVVTPDMFASGQFVGAVDFATGRAESIRGFHARMSANRATDCAGAITVINMIMIRVELATDYTSSIGTIIVIMTFAAKRTSAAFTSRIMLMDFFTARARAILLPIMLVLAWLFVAIIQLAASRAKTICRIHAQVTAFCRTNRADTIHESVMMIRIQLTADLAFSVRAVHVRMLARLFNDRNCQTGSFARRDRYCGIRIQPSNNLSRFIAGIDLAIQSHIFVLGNRIAQARILLKQLFQNRIGQLNTNFGRSAIFLTKESDRCEIVTDSHGKIIWHRGCGFADSPTRFCNQFGRNHANRVFLAGF